MRPSSPEHKSWTSPIVANCGLHCAQWSAWPNETKDQTSSDQTVLNLIMNLHLQLPTLNIGRNDLLTQCHQRHHGPVRRIAIVTHSLPILTGVSRRVVNPKSRVIAGGIKAVWLSGSLGQCLQLHQQKWYAPVTSVERDFQYQEQVPAHQFQT